MSNKAPVAKSSTPAMFLHEADIDYILARLISFTGAAFAGRAGYLSQQAIEKYLKAVSVQHNGEYLKSHDLKELAAYCARFDDDFNDKQLITYLTIFDDFAEVGRYGGEAAYDPHARKSPEFQTWGVMFWSEDYRKKLDNLVYIIRRKLDFSKISFVDNLQAVLKEDRAAFFVAEWKFPVKLREVLTTGNDYFK